MIHSLGEIALNYNCNSNVMIYAARNNESAKNILIKIKLYKTSFSSL